MPKKTALLVGINYHDSASISPLKGCINDVRLAKEILTSKYEFFSDNIVEMTDVSSDPRLLPTKVNILRELNQIVSKAKSGAVVYVHFSCHGARQPKKDAKGQLIPNKLEEVVVPMDMEIRGGDFINPIVDHELHAIFQKIAPGVNFTIIFDCCHSGVTTDTRDISRTTVTNARARAIEHPSLRSNTSRDISVDHTRVVDSRGLNDNAPVFYAACDVLETAADIPFGSSNYGAFSYCFYNTLRFQKNPPMLHSLMTNTSDLLRHFGMNQQAQLYTHSDKFNSSFSVAISHPEFFPKSSSFDPNNPKRKVDPNFIKVTPEHINEIASTRSSRQAQTVRQIIEKRSFQSANLRAIANMPLDALYEVFPGRATQELEEMKREAFEAAYQKIPLPSRAITQTRSVGDAVTRGLLGDIVSMTGPVALNLIGTFLNPGKRDLDQRQATRGFLSGLVKVGGPIVGKLATGVVGALVGKRHLAVNQEIEALEVELLQRGGPTTHLSGAKLLSRKVEPHVALADILATSDLGCVERAADVSGERGFWKDFSSGLLGTVVDGVSGMISGFASRNVGNESTINRTQQGIIGELFAAGGLRAAELGVQLINSRDLNEKTSIVNEIFDVADVQVAPLLSRLIQESDRKETSSITREAPIIDHYAAYPEEISNIDLTEEEKLHIRDLILIGGRDNGATAAGLGVRMVLNRESPEEVKRGLLSNLVKIAGPVALNVGKQLLTGIVSQRGILSSLPKFSTILQVAKNKAPVVLKLVAELLQADTVEKKRAVLKSVFDIAGPVVLKLVSKLIDKGEHFVGDILFGPDSRAIYGTDSRTSTIPEEWEDASKCVVSVWRGGDVIKKEDGSFKLKTEPFKMIDMYPLHHEEKFYNEPTGAFGSGFLVKDHNQKPTLIVTAGHVIHGEDLKTLKFVFGWRGADKVPASDVYSASSVVGMEYDEKDDLADWAVVKLDREVDDKWVPANIADDKTTEKAKTLSIMGHPSGLPLKYATGKVHQSGDWYITTSLDAFEGNSGSPVFDSGSQQVVGILVNGKDDYEQIKLQLDEIKKLDEAQKIHYAYASFFEVSKAKVYPESPGGEKVTKVNWGTLQAALNK